MLRLIAAIFIIANVIACTAQVEPTPEPTAEVAQGLISRYHYLQPQFPTGENPYFSVGWTSSNTNDWAGTIDDYFAGSGTDAADYIASYTPSAVFKGVRGYMSPAVNAQINSISYFYVTGRCTSWAPASMQAAYITDHATNSLADQYNYWIGCNSTESSFTSTIFVNRPNGGGAIQKADFYNVPEESGEGFLFVMPSTSNIVWIDSVMVVLATLDNY